MKSLRSKLILPLAISWLLTMVFVFGVSYREITNLYISHVTHDAFLLGDTFNQTTISSTQLTSMRIVANKMVRQEEAIRGIGVATKDPFVMWASSIRPMEDRAGVTKRMLRALFDATSKGRFSATLYGDGFLELAIPMEPLDTVGTSFEDPELVMTKWRSFLEDWLSSVVIKYGILPVFIGSDDVHSNVLNIEKPSLYRGAIFLRLDARDLLVRLNKSVLLFGGIILFGSLIAALMAYLLLNRLVLSPITKIKQVMDQQASGRRQARTNFDQNDEVGVIGASFDQLMDKLIYVETEIVKHRDQLQTMVEERTHSLLIERDRAKDANKAKSEFLASMSHEFRTPLNAIIGFSQVIGQQSFGLLGNPKYSEYANDIQVSGEYLLSLIDDILDISAIEAGKRDLVRKPVVITELIDESISIVSEAAQKKGIELSAQATAVPPIYADRRGIRQILLNLFSNAVKFTPAGGRVTATTRPSKGGVTFVIEDTGIGIAPEDIREVTTAFTKGERDPYRAAVGWGLGLSITKSLIDLHSGEITIESTFGKGTAITVTLPEGRATSAPNPEIES